MDYSNKSITMDNGKKYIVIEQVNYEGGIYLYLVNDNDEKDTAFVEVKDGNAVQIDPTLFKDEIFPLFAEKLNN